ncbi:MAG: FecR family protein [bacterium]
MKRKDKKNSSRFGVVYGILLIFNFSFLILDSARSAESPLAVLSKAEGKVRVMKPEQEKWLTGKTGMFLYGGDRIKTEKSSKAVINFISGVEISVNAETEFMIKAEEDKGQKKEELDLIFGELLSKVPKGGDYKVKTPQAVTAVRGTKFGVIAGGGMTSVYVLDGEVDVFNSYGKISCRKGEKTTVGPGAAPTAPEDMKEEDMEKQAGWSEPEKEDVEIKIELKSEKGFIAGLPLEVELTAEGSDDYKGKIQVETTPDDFNVTKVMPWTDGALKFYCIKETAGPAVINVTGKDIKTIVTAVNFDEAQEKELRLELNDDRKLKLKFTK